MANKGIAGGTKPTKFFNFWVEKPEFDPLVTNVWNKVVLS